MFIKVQRLHVEWLMPYDWTKFTLTCHRIRIAILLIHMIIRIPSISPFRSPVYFREKGYSFRVIQDFYFYRKHRTKNNLSPMILIEHFYPNISIKIDTSHQQRAMEIGECSLRNCWFINQGLWSFVIQGLWFFCNSRVMIFWPSGWIYF